MGSRIGSRFGVQNRVQVRGPGSGSKRGGPRFVNTRSWGAQSTLITEVFPSTRKIERKEKPLKKSCQDPVEHAR